MGAPQGKPDGCPSKPLLGVQVAVLLRCVESSRSSPGLRAIDICTLRSQSSVHSAARESLRVSEILTNRHRDRFCSKNAFSEQSPLARSGAPTLVCSAQLSAEAHFTLNQQP
jgi:hypothetical protein